MTAIFYRRFFPFDVDGTVAYVAPLSFGAPDERYPTYLDTIGPSRCRQAVRDAATEMLANRRAAMEQHAQAEATANYYSFTQELSRVHQGKISGALGTIAWIGSGTMQWLVGRDIDANQSYAKVIAIAGILPVLACIVLWLLWGVIRSGRL